MSHLANMPFKPFTSITVACAFVLPVFASADQGAMQFDLTCRLHGRLVVDRHADLTQPSGYLGPAIWADTVRYAIDLRHGRYMGTDWKLPVSERIARVTKSQLLLSQRRDSFERIDRQTGRYAARSKAGNYMIEIVTGQCRRADFSGFPAALEQTRKR